MQAKDHDIPIELLRQCLAYDEPSSTLVWKVRPREHFESDWLWKRFNTRWAGKPAGTPHGKGYIRIGLVIAGSRKRFFHASRAAYAVVTGAWPPHRIDHRDGQRDNNRWSNIRPATDAENSQNLVSVRNSTGLMGVFKRKAGGPKPYRSGVRVGGVMHWLGSYATPEEARDAYLKAKAKLHAFQPVPRA